MMHVPPGFGRVHPYLTVADAAAYIGFLVDGLGAEEVGRTVVEGRIANARICFGGVTTLMVGEPREDTPVSRVALYLYVEDADAAVARAIAHGATLRMAVAEMPYDERQGGVNDPAGITWWLSQRLVAGPYR